MIGSVIRSVVILPGMGLIVIPALILWISWSTSLAGRSANIESIFFWSGLLLGAIGVAMIAWTVSLFARVGRGTLAPWEPPQRLVVQGPYRHVRNPMISGVLAALLGEALFFRSWPLAGWFMLFFIANAIYFPLVEEPGLQKRFGQDYSLYKRNVPRWLPHLRAWDLPSDTRP